MSERTKLSINIDHIATLREVRKTSYPEPIWAIPLCDMGGADGITFHLREDRRHIQDRDLRLFGEVSSLPLNFEMACSQEMISLAKELKPLWVTIVPEKREELTTEGGMDVGKQLEFLKKNIQELNGSCKVCLFVDPDLHQIDSAYKTGCFAVEIHTGEYANSSNPSQEKKELEKIILSTRHAKELGLRVHAGHGIHYQNVENLARIPEIQELSIGHAVIVRALFVGLLKAVKEMKQLILNASLLS